MFIDSNKNLMMYYNKFSYQYLALRITLKNISLNIWILIKRDTINVILYILLYMLGIVVGSRFKSIIVFAVSEY